MFLGGSQEVPVDSKVTAHPIQPPSPPMPPTSLAMAQIPRQVSAMQYLSSVIPSFQPPMLFPPPPFLADNYDFMQFGRPIHTSPIIQAFKNENVALPSELSPILIALQRLYKNLITGHEGCSLERPLNPHYLLGLEDSFPQAGDSCKNMDKSPFTQVMKGKDRCTFCLRGKKGKVNPIYVHSLTSSVYETPTISIGHAYGALKRTKSKSASSSDRGAANSLKTFLRRRPSSNVARFQFLYLKSSKRIWSFPNSRPPRLYSDSPSTSEPTKCGVWLNF